MAYKDNEIDISDLKNAEITVGNLKDILSLGRSRREGDGMQASRHPKIPEGLIFCPLWRGLVSECREINEPLTASARMVPGGWRLFDGETRSPR